LGTVSRDRVMDILKALVANDATMLMQHVAELADLSPDYANVLAELLALLHQMALAQKVPQAVDENIIDREALLQLSTQVSSEDIQLFYQVGLIGRRDLPLAPDPRSGLEMALLRMLAFKPNLQARAASTVMTQSKVVSPPNQPVTSSVEQRPAAQVQSAPHPVAQAAAQSISTEPAAEPAKVIQFDGNWAGLVEAMNLRGMVKQLAVNCNLKEKSATEVRLTLNQENEQLLNPGLQSKLEEALCNSLQQKLKLRIDLGVLEVESPAQTQARNIADRQQSAEESIQQDPMVQALKENFNAEVVPNSVKPLNE